MSNDCGRRCFVQYSLGLFLDLGVTKTVGFQMSWGCPEDGTEFKRETKND